MLFIIANNNINGTKPKWTKPKEKEIDHKIIQLIRILSQHKNHNHSRCTAIFNSLPDRNSLCSYRFCSVCLPTAWKWTICAKNHKCTNNIICIYDCAFISWPNVDLLLVKWFLLSSCVHYTPVLYIFIWTYRFGIVDADGFSLSAFLYLFFFFLFIFIKLPVCKSPSQNHDLFYAVQMLCFALVLFFVCLSFWFKPTRRVYLFTVCVLPGLVIFSYHFLHLSLMLDLICLKYLLVYSTRLGLSIGVNISLEC